MTYDLNNGGTKWTMVQYSSICTESCWEPGSGSRWHNLPFPRVQHSAVSVLGFECTTVPGQDHVSVCLFLCVFSTQNNTEPRLGDTGKSDMMIGVYFQSR